MNKTLVLKRRLLAESVKIRNSSEIRRSRSAKLMGIDRVAFKIATVLNPGYWKVEKISETKEKFMENGNRNVDKTFFRKKDELIKHSDVHFRQKYAFDRNGMIKISRISHK